MFTVIAYDIVDDRVRYRVAEALKRYAVRVQKSVFEAADLSPRDFHRLRAELEELIDPAVDSIRYYFLCASCVPRTEISGLGEVTEKEEYRVV